MQGCIWKYKTVVIYPSNCGGDYMNRIMHICMHMIISRKLQHKYKAVPQNALFHLIKSLVMPLMYRVSGVTRWCKIKLKIFRKHITKNPAARSMWSKLGLVIKLARTLKYNPSLLLVSQNKSMQGKFIHTYYLTILQLSVMPCFY